MLSTDARVDKRAGQELLSRFLLLSVKENDIQSIKKLLKNQQNVNLNFKNSKGECALLISVKQRNYQMTKLLLSNDNTDPNIT